MAIIYNIYRDPEIVKLAYTSDSIWRNRDEFFQGRDAIVQFLTRKWERENGYRLRKELFAFSSHKVRGFRVPLRVESHPRNPSTENLYPDFGDSTRLQSSSGMSGMMRADSGGVRMGWKIGLLRTMGS